MTLSRSAVLAYQNGGKNVEMKSSFYLRCIKCDEGNSRCSANSENKVKERPIWTPHVAFVDASHYRLQIIFLLSQACL